MLVVSGLDAWFAERLKDTGLRVETTAYVTGVLSRRRWEAADMSNESIVQAFQNARSTGGFAAYQRIGDWVLFVSTVMPNAMRTEQEAIQTIGQLAYLSCYRLINRKWDVYEELADQLPLVARRVRHMLV